jgi:glucose/arabinose dehydrogenase
MKKPIQRLSIKNLGALLSIVLVSLLTFSCDEDDDGGAFPGNRDLKVTTVARDLDTPWEIAFAPDGRMFFTERPGVVRVTQNGQTSAWLKLDSVATEIGESGLTGIAIDPDFANNGYVYVAFTYAQSKSPLVLVNKIVRYKENPQTKVPAFDKTLIDGIPGNYLHNVGPLKFGPDGKLYATVGEIFKPELAQDPNSLNGKILRMNPDGTVPSDNPTAGSYVYSLGHRNPQGLAFQPETGRIYATEHGPSEEQGCCQDEINLIEAGKNYGWPLITGSKTQAGLEAPIYYSGDTATWAPAGATFVTNGAWKGSMVFTGLRGQALYRAILDPNDPKKVTEVKRYFYQEYGRLRDVTEGPDGKLYLSVSNQDGRGKPDDDDDRILAIEVAADAE